jgi:hypothetical protein
MCNSHLTITSRPFSTPNLSHPYTSARCTLETSCVVLLCTFMLSSCLICFSSCSPYRLKDKGCWGRAKRKPVRINSTPGLLAYTHHKAGLKLALPIKRILACLFPPALQFHYICLWWRRFVRRTEGALNRSQPLVSSQAKAMHHGYVNAVPSSRITN